MVPPWASAYTININTQMNYWPAEVTNLPELAEPLFRMVQRDGGHRARWPRARCTTRRGWVLHHNTTIWRDAFPVDGNTRAAFWNMAGGWFASHFWERYLFTGDRKFLASEAYPIMKGAAEFYADWLIDAGDGTLVTPVSTSPENRFVSPGGGQASAAFGSTMDLAIIRELFARTIEAAEILGRDAGLRKELCGQAGQAGAVPASGPAGSCRNGARTTPRASPSTATCRTCTASIRATRSTPRPRPSCCGRWPARWSCAATRPPAGRWGGR